MQSPFDVSSVKITQDSEEKEDHDQTHSHALEIYNDLLHGRNHMENYKYCKEVPRLLRLPVVGFITAMANNAHSKHQFRDALCDMSAEATVLTTMGLAIGHVPAVFSFLTSHLAQAGLDYFPTWNQINEMPRSSIPEMLIYLRRFEARAQVQSAVIPSLATEAISGYVKSIIEAITTRHTHVSHPYPKLKGILKREERKTGWDTLRTQSHFVRQEPMKEEETVFHLPQSSEPTSGIAEAKVSTPTKPKPSLSAKLDHNLNIMDVGFKAETQELLQQNQEMQAKLDLVCEHLVKMQEDQNQRAIKEQKEADMRHLQSACESIGELGRRFEDRAIMKISSFASSGLQIYSAIDTLSTATTFAAKASSMLAIPLALMSCVSLFMGDDDGDDGANMQQFFMELLTHFCAQLHKHLEFIHNDLARRIITGFNENREAQGNMMDWLRKIYHESHNARLETRERLDTLSSTIQAQGVCQQNKDRTHKIASIFKEINLSLGPHQLSSDKFIELFNSFKTEIGTTHPADSILVGQKDIHHAALLKNFEADNDNPFAADFNIRPFYDNLVLSYPELKNEAVLINPTVFSWQLLGFMQLLQTRYKQNNNPENLMAKAEVKILEELLALGQKTNASFTVLRDKAILQKLVLNYLSSGDKFLKQLKGYRQQKERVINQELYNQFIQNVNGLNLANRRQFEEQEPEIEYRCKPEWWTGSHTNNHYKWNGADFLDRFNIGRMMYDLKLMTAANFNAEVKHEEKPTLIRKDNGHYQFWGKHIQVGPPVTLQEQRRYKLIGGPQPQRSSTEVWQLTEVDELRDLQPYLSRFDFNASKIIAINLYNPKYYAFKEWHYVNEGYFGIAKDFIKNYFKGRQESVNKFLHEYPERLHTMLAKNQVAQTSILNTSFNFNHRELSLSPHYYYAYAYPKQIPGQENPYTLVLPLPKYQFVIPPILQRAEWLGAGQIDFEYSIDANKQFVLDCYFHDSNKLLIASLKTTFNPSIYTENEALFWWWFGCNHSNGNVKFERMREHTSPEENYWLTDSTHTPNCTDYVGHHAKIEVQNAELKEATLTTHVTDTSPVLSTTMLPKIQKQVSCHIKEFYSALLSDIFNNEQTGLTRNLMEYSFNFYMLKFALNLGFREQNYKLNPDLMFLSNESSTVPNQKTLTPLLRNRLDLKRFLETDNANEFLLIEHLEKNLLFVKTILSPTIDNVLQTIPLANHFADALDIFREMVFWYSDHSVDENRLVSSKGRDKLLEEENETLRIFLQTAGEALLGLPVEFQEKMLANFKQKLGEKGMHCPTGFSLLPCLTETESTGEQKSNSAKNSSSSSSSNSGILFSMFSNSTSTAKSQARLTTTTASNTTTSHAIFE